MSPISWSAVKKPRICRSDRRTDEIILVIAGTITRKVGGKIWRYKSTEYSVIAGQSYSISWHGCVDDNDR